MKQISKFTIATLLLNSSLTIMVGSVIAPALPAISKNLDFGLSPGLLVTLPSLGVVISSFFVGNLVDKLGPFKLLSLGLIPYAILGFIGVYLKKDYLLIADRLLLGATCVAIQVSVTTFIAEMFSGKERLKIIAWQGMAIEMGGVIFLSIGGYIGEISWQYPFYIYLIALLFFIFTWYSLPKSIADDKQNKDETKDSVEIKSKRIYPIMIGSFFSMAIFFVCYVNLPQYLPDEFGFSESSTGYFMSSISLIAVIIASQLPKITSKISSNYTVVLGFLFFSIGYILFAFAPSQWILYAAALCTGIGFGFTVPLLNHMVVETSSRKNRGKNLGTYSMMVFAGQFSASFTEFLPVSIRNAFLVTVGIGILTTIILFILFKKFD